SIHGIMYTVLNTTPIAPSARNPDLPEILDLIVAKSLAKEMAVRYQSVKELTSDLYDCMQMLNGQGAAPFKAATGARSEALPPNTTRREDKVRTIHRAVSRGATVAPEQVAMTVSKAFDSYEATLRLAALTGVEREALGLTRPKAATVAAPAKAANPPAEDKKRVPSAPPSRQVSHYYVAWIVAAVAAIVAAVLFALRQV
ncbi:MAG: hypothetical protein ABI612_17710, partial [Betaproteobacteria bacterium]